MKTRSNIEIETGNDNWLCHLCGKEADPIYFVDGKRVCEECRKDMLSKQKEQKAHDGK